FDINKNEKAITPYIRALFGGTENSRDFSPAVPANSYADTDVAIDAAGVAGVQGKYFSWLGDNITHKGFEAVDISNALRIEFDLYIEDYNDFMTVYNNAGFNGTSGTSSFRFRLLNTSNISNNLLYTDLDIDQITQSGWNHISVNIGRFSNRSFDSTSVTGYDLYLENYGSGKTNRNYLNASSGMVFAISNLYATGNDTSKIIPPVNNVHNTMVELNVGNPKYFSAFDRAYRQGFNQEGLTPVDFTGVDYVEFDLYVESKQRLFDTLNYLDTVADPGVNHRLSLRLSSNTNNCAADDIRIDEISNYITNDGWNHIAMRLDGTVFGSYDAANTCSWLVSFENTWSKGLGTDLNGYIYGDTFVLANLCGTKFTIPEVSNVYGTVAGLNVGNPMAFSAFDLAYRLGFRQEGLTPVDFTGSDYVEFDLYVESKQRLFDTLNYLDTVADPGVNHRWSLRISSNADNCTADDIRIDEISNYIKNDGWNHIVARLDGTVFGSYDVTNTCSWVVSFENTWSKGLGTDISSYIGGNTFVLANLCGTKFTAPEVNNVMGEAVAELNVGNGLKTSGWRFGRYYDAGCYQEDLTPVDLSDAEYIEFDMFVEDRQGILDAIADLDSKNGDAGSRWRFILSSIPGDYRGSNYANVYFVEFFESYITKDGWNHIVIPMSEFECNGSPNLSSIASWGIDFYIATGDTNIAKDQTLAVYNICGTKTVVPHTHTVGEWLSDATDHWHVCTGCEEILDKAAHTASDWIVDVEATAEAAGHQHKECTVCGKVLEEEDIPKLTTHTPGDINGDGELNNKDLTRFFQYLSDWDVEVNEAAL
ncbi:MAG: hypothetical protein J5662_07850, partial [Clostridia bacterium]|nr:hypothetical protein [Clostridia bacterium]